MDIKLIMEANVKYKIIDGDGDGGKYEKVMCI
jgi:hypothetical protein